jgi:hypothetical protein
MAFNKRKRETETLEVEPQPQPQPQPQPSSKVQVREVLSDQKIEVYKNLLKVLKEAVDGLQTQLKVWETLQHTTTWPSLISKLDEKASLLTEEQRKKIHGRATFKEISEWFDIPCLKKLMYYYPTVKLDETEQVSTSEKFQIWELTESWMDASSGFTKFFQDRKHTDKDLNEFIQEFADVIATTWAVEGIIVSQEDPPKEDPPKEDPPKEDPPKEDNMLESCSLTAVAENREEKTESFDKASKISCPFPKSITDIYSHLTLEEWMCVYSCFHKIETELCSGLDDENSLSHVSSLHPCIRKDFLLWLDAVKAL